MYSSETTDGFLGVSFRLMMTREARAELSARVSYFSQLPLSRQKRKKSRSHLGRLDSLLSLL